MHCKIISQVTLSEITQFGSKNGIKKRKQRSVLNVKGHKSTKNEETGLMI